MMEENLNNLEILKKEKEIQTEELKNEILENNKFKEKKELISGPDEIIIIYKIEKVEDKNPKKIRIFGDIFVKNNKEKCKIIIDEKELDLCSHLEINNKDLKNDKFELKLKGINAITNLSYMFNSDYEEPCPLISLPDISKKNTENVTEMANMFYNCHSLISLPEISKWNTKNVTDMNIGLKE